MDVQEREEQRRQELLKLYFEFFKHFTTLGAAAGVVLLALYRAGIGEQEMLAYPLVMFGLAAVAAAFGMSVVLIRFRSGEAAGRGLSGAMYLVASLFAGGLLLFLDGVLGIPGWVLWVSLAGLVVLTALDFYIRRHG